ncbi:hypothetical protein ACIQ6Y_32700 [Streptomyces sp. NPDC096205]|uniref:hypothetical protein n=1 Tax=Streptomyces sp. NPDC096205 TaxID=3366081 RepID=UPI0037FEA1E3
MATTGLLVLAMANPASAVTMENDTAVRDTSDAGDGCITMGNLSATACFKPYGDVVFAVDMLPDAYSVYALWQNELRNSVGTWGLYRNGKCSWSGSAPSKGSCNKDMYEHSSSNAWGGKGSRVRVKACTNDLGDDTCSGWSSWIYNQ